MTTREKLIQAGVKHLIEFGYTDCNKHNIMTDVVYKRFFAASLLKVTKQETTNVQLIAVIDAMLKEIA